MVSDRSAHRPMARGVKTLETSRRSRRWSAQSRWIIVFEPELHIVDQVLVPDLAGWRRERAQEIPDVTAVGVPPDWVCEVLSPSTAKIDRSRKVRHYAAADVGHVWLVDPLATTLEIYRLDSKGWRLIDTLAGDVVARAEPFDAIELDLASLWRR